MSLLNDLLPDLQAGRDLDLIEADRAARELASADVDSQVKQDFLLALNEKGEKPDEVAGFASAFRKLARKPKLDEYADQAIDVCGTGGDKSHSFNISTAVTLVLAASGVPVFKHGNRSITSKCGSAELLQALGVKFLEEPKELRKAMKALNFVFFFAPSFHPAFKEIMPVRKALAEAGRRTIFNILGPMINPGSPAHQLTGVFSEKWVGPMAEAFNTLGLKNGFIVHTRMGEGRGMDELACCGEPVSAGFGNSIGSCLHTKWERLDMKPCPESDLKGGDVNENVEILKQLIAGKAPQGLEDTVCLNAGAGLFITGRATSLQEGILQARESLLGGPVADLLAKISEYFAS